MSPASFSLDDDSDGTLSNTRTFSNLTIGTYSLSETVPSGWRLDAVRCIDPSGNSTVDVGDGAATIQLGAGEAVACTFRNVQRGSLPATGRILMHAALLGLAAIALGRGLRMAARSAQRSA